MFNHLELATQPKSRGFYSCPNSTSLKIVKYPISEWKRPDLNLRLEHWLMIDWHINPLSHHNSDLTFFGSYFLRSNFFGSSFFGSNFFGSSFFGTNFFGSNFFWILNFDCCKQSLTRLYPPSIHPSTLLSSKIFNSKYSTQLINIFHPARYLTQYIRRKFLTFSICNFITLQILLYFEITKI